MRRTDHYFLCCFNVLSASSPPPAADGLTQCGRRTTASVRYFFAPAASGKRLRRPTPAGIFGVPQRAPRLSRANAIHAADNALSPASRRRCADAPTSPPRSVVPPTRKAAPPFSGRKARRRASARCRKGLLEVKEDMTRNKEGALWSNTARMTITPRPRCLRAIVWPKAA